MDEEFKLRGRLVYCLKRSHLSVRHLMDESLAQYGLTAAQMEIMGAVCNANGLEHRVLVDWLGVASPTLTSIVDGLVKRGLIERRTSAEDARVKKLYVTDEGWGLFEQIKDGRDAFLSQLTAGFSDEEIDQFSEYLLRLAENCGDDAQMPFHLREEEAK